MNNDLIHVNTLPPFKRLCMTIGELPTSYLETMTYYEMLVWFTEYMRNTVIPTINNNGLAVEELQEKYIELKTFVDTYFDNLDVQEEINNKIDAMVESGEFLEIITTYLSDNITMSYDTVGALKLADNLQAGNRCFTLGYHTKNDGGGAKYKIRTITNEDVTDEMLLIALADETLVAELIATNEINIKQLGAKDDNETNNQTIFDAALSNFNVVYVPKGTNPYLLTYLNVPENKTLIGIGKPQINSDRIGTDNFNKCNSGSRMENIIINSTNENLAYNRFSLENVNNVTIKNCTFKGFRDTSSPANAWGVLISTANNISLSDCYFDDNTQSDIAIVNDVNNLIIENCDGTALKINFEPDVSKTIKYVTVNNCKNISRLNILDNTLTEYAISDVIISNSKIATFTFKGGNITLDNTKIGSIVQRIQSGITFGGIIKNNNSFGYYENLNDDPLLLHCAMRDTSTPLGDRAKKFWNTAYGTINSGINRVIDSKKGEIIQMNIGHTSGVVGLYRLFSVTPGKTYAIRTLMNTISGSTLVYAGYSVKVGFYTNEGSHIETCNIAVDRNDVNAESIWAEKIVFVTPPDTTALCRIEIDNCYTQSPSTAAANYGYLLFNEVNLDSTLDEYELKSYGDDDNIYSVSFSSMNLKGDIIYYKDPVTAGYIGKICTVAGNPGTWKNFGAISS